MFWLPILLVLIFVTIQAYAGEKGMALVSLFTVLIHSVIVMVVFLEHDLLWMLIFLTLQMWALFVVTFFQRNRWRKFE